MQLTDATKLNALLESARSKIAILLPQNPSYDAVASALALKLSLEAANRQVVVACSNPMTVEFHRLVGVDTVSGNFGSKNLVITFPGQTEAVDKVSYNIENGVLQLVITPKTDQILDHKKLQFVSGGASADLVFLVGVRSLSELGQMYTDAQDFLTKVPTYTIAGPLFSQEVTQLIASLQLPLSSDAASNLLSGLERATQNFQAGNVNADTFETAATLMRKGARRQSNLAQASHFPDGTVPIGEQPRPQAPTDDWYEPKIYSNDTSLS